MRELVKGKNTIGRTAAVLKKPYKATFTFTFYMLPLSVHRAILNAFKVKTNLKTLNHGQ